MKEKTNRWIAKHQTASKVINIVIWVIVGVFLLDMGWPAWLAYLLIAIMSGLYVIVISAAVTAAFWLVTQNIMSKKLNLE